MDKGAISLSQAPGREAGAGADEHVFLVGRPPMGEFLGFIKTLSVDAQNADLAALATEWRQANDHVLDLDRREAGFADHPPINDLPASLTPLVERLTADPVFRRSFQLVPTTIGMIELDRLVVFQKQVNLAYVRQVQAALGNDPTPEEIFQLCLPLDRPHPPAKFLQTGPNIYTLVSASNDCRFLEAVPFDPLQLIGYTPGGSAVAVVGLVLGFGSNFLHAVHMNDRLILGNGSHRAFALREMGITQVPCIIQEVSRREELELLGLSDVQRNPDHFLTASRPPMLKDYFDPALRKIVMVHRKNRLVRVSFGVEQADIPAA